MIEKLQADLKEAMISKNVTKRDILRFIISQIKNKQIELQKDPTDDEITKIIKKEIKQIDETREHLTEWSDELAVQDEKKAILGEYLPEMLSEDALKGIVTQTVEKLGIDDPKANRGPVIGAIMWEYGATVDGSMLNEIINTL